MTERNTLIQKLALSFLLSNLDDACEAFEIVEEEECPNCECGTVGLEDGRLVCRGECGEDFGKPGESIHYNGQIVPRPTEDEIGRLLVQ